MAAIHIKTRQIVVASYEFEGLCKDAQQLILRSGLTPREAMLLLNYRALDDDSKRSLV